MQIFSDEFKKWLATELDNGRYGFNCRIDKDDLEVLFTRIQLENITPHTVQIEPSDFKISQDFFISNDDFIIDSRL